MVDCSLPTVECIVNDIIALKRRADMAISEVQVCVNSNLEKHLEKLKQPAKRAKSAIISVLEKSHKRFKEEAEKLESVEKNEHLLRKLEMISSDVELLKNLSEEDVITFAFQTERNLMAIAANPRLPKTVRMKARVASHKPLSTHLNRMKRRFDSVEEDEVKDETSKTLDKISVNKQIVLMRKDVKRAKIHIIHKLSRRIQVLRRSKCTGEKKEKLEKKAERLVKKIKYIDGFEPDDISRFALTNTKDLNKMSNDITWPLKTQAMATIAIHKFVAGPVANFKSSFPDMHKTVPAILKNKKKKRKLNVETKEIVKGSKNLLDKAKSDNVNNQNVECDDEEDKASCHLEEQSDTESRIDQEEESVLDEESDEEQSEDIKKCSIIDEDVPSPEESDRESRIDQEEESGEEQSEDIDKCSNIDEDVPSPNESDSSSHEQHVAGKNIKKKLGIHPAVSKKSFKDTPMKNENKLAKPKITKKNNSSAIKNNKSISKKPMSKLSENKPTVVDPFFVTATNEEYITTQVPTIDESDSKWDDSSSARPNRFNKDNKKSKWSNREDRWTKDKFGNRDIAPYRKPFTDRFEKLPKSNNGPVPNIFANRKERRKALHQTVQEKIEKLHPSWEAKKKQTAIAKFQGKKIVFD